MKSLLLSVLCFFHIVAHTTTYYVSTTGNDANPGTIGSPFFTWEKLSTVLVAGDIAYIRGGIYRSGKGPASPWLVQWFNINGTAGNPINILAYPGESPVMDLSNVLSTVNGFGIYVRNCNYVNFKGLRITGWQQNPSGNSFFLWNNENCTNLKIEQCEVDNSQCYGFF